MGRTLHYDIKKKRGNFTKKEAEILYAISMFYNTGPYEKVWTCENFFIDVGKWYPNWTTFKKKHPEWESSKCWDHIENRIEEAKKTHTNRVDVLEAVVKEGWIYWDEKPNTKERHGFVKTQGNEFNSLLVFNALLKISLQIKCRITLYDEGNFLKFSNVIIEDGKCLPDLKDINEDVDRHIKNLAISMLSPEALFTYENRQQLKDEKFRDLYHDLDLENPYGMEHSRERLNESIKQALDAYELILPGFLAYHCKRIDNYQRKCAREHKAVYSFDTKVPPLLLFNLKSLPSKYWLEPEKVCRPVNPDDFKTDDYKPNYSTLMAGFYGEYWNLTDKDAEEESLKMMQHVFKALAAIPDGTEISYLGQENDKEEIK